MSTGGTLRGKPTPQGQHRRHGPAVDACAGRARAATEVPFAFHLFPGEVREFGAADDGCRVRVGRVTDRAFCEGGAWTIVEYKTGATTLGCFRRWVDLYAACAERTTGQSAGGHVGDAAGETEAA